MAEPKSYALIPEAGNTKVGEKVFEVLGKVIADKIKLGLHDRWFRNHQLRRNQHWKAKSPAGVPLVSANLIYTHQQRTVNTLTDNDPTFNVAAVGKVEEGQKDSLGDLQRCTEHYWRDSEQQDVFESCVINGEEYGITILKSVFNPDIEYGLGEAEHIPVDPFHFGWYPPKLAYIRDLQKCEALVHFWPVSVRQLRAEFPDKAEKIKPDSELLKELKDDERREVIGEAGAGKGSVMTTVASVVRELLNFVSGTGGEDDDEETLQCEMWLRDKTTITEDVTEERVDEVTGMKSTVTERVTRPKYTGEIRRILVCSGGVVLKDEDNPNINKSLSPEQQQQTFLFDKYPFTGANSIKDTSNAWGFSDTEQGEWLNMEIDKCLSQMVVEKDRSARKKLILPKGCGVPPEHLTNFVGIIEPVNAAEAAGIRWLETPQSSIDYDKVLATMKDLFFLVMGSFELDQAQGTGRDVIAYKAIAALLERAATMMRGKIRSYSRLIRDWGRMYISHVQNFYTEERYITYKDADGKEASKTIIGTNLLMPVKLTVVSGSTMPISRVQQREEALALYKEQAIDQMELLEKLDWSNRGEVVKRMMAGPLGQVLQKLMTVGVPEELAEYIKAVGETDPKDLQKAIEKGEFPPFEQFAQKLIADMQGQETQPDAAQTEAQAALKEIEAKVQKAAAEIGLINEKAITERINQTVALAGVDFDKESIAIKRAEVVHQMEEDAKGHQEEGIKTGLDIALRKQQAEQGAEIEHKKIDTGAKLKKAEIDRAGRAGYNENKGAKSNNKKA